MSSSAAGPVDPVPFFVTEFCSRYQPQAACYAKDAYEIVKGLPPLPKTCNQASWLKLLKSKAKQRETPVAPQKEKDHASVPADASGDALGADQKQPQTTPVTPGHGEPTETASMEQPEGVAEAGGSTTAAGADEGAGLWFPRAQLQPPKFRKLKFCRPGVWAPK